jgi:tetratricopeptide (TPR) repeat protein
VAHPVQTQAVTYIVQRFTSLATLFYLASVVFYVMGRLASAQADKRASSLAGRLFSRQAGMLLLSLLSAVCAMKVKEISFTLPIMILLYEFIFFRSTLKRKLLFLIPILLTLVIVPISVLHIDKPLGELLSDLSEKSRLQTDMPRGDYLMTELRVIVTYIRLIFLPVDQNLDYDYPIYRSFFSPPVFLSFLFLATLFGIALYLLYKSRRGTAVSSENSAVSSEQTEAEGRRLKNDSPSAASHSLLTIHYFRLIAFGILWFFVALSVESSFIPIVDVIFEHRLYLPSIGAFVALSAALFVVAMKAKHRWPGAGKAVTPLVLIIVLMLSAVTYARNRVWQDETRLWEDVVRKSPGNARAHNNLCFIYAGNGKTDQAIEQCRAALGLLPDYLDARVNLGVAYNARGMYDQAIEEFMIALRMNPDDADAHNNLGIAYVSKSMFDEAITHYQIALRLWPGYAEAYNNLGVAYGSKGLYDQAIRYFEQAIDLKADYFEANYNLALLFEKMGDHEKALDQYNKANDMKAADDLP